MGIVNPGTPDNHIIFLKNKMNLDIFVEGGTYTGATAIRMGKLFDRVITIEKSPEMSAIASKNISNAGTENIDLLVGDTRNFLKNILVENNNILFWLDAHWSGGQTYGKENECPLIQELEIIFSDHKNYLILIDDARLFLSPPPEPHNFLEWPTIRDILNVTPGDCELLVYDDVIYIVPEFILNIFRNFLQSEVTLKWNQKKQSTKSSLFASTLTYAKNKLNRPC